jgi:hypothetical protein
MRIHSLYYILIYFHCVSDHTIIIISGASSCNKVRTLPAGGSISFSVDTVKFDTVFTAAGSFTYSFLIYNPQGEEITISSVRMQAGTLRVNLFKTKTHHNPELALQYLTGLFQGTKANMERMCEKVIDSEYHQIQHFISESSCDWQEAFDPVPAGLNEHKYD